MKLAKENLTTTAQVYSLRSQSEFHGQFGVQHAGINFHAIDGSFIIHRRMDDKEIERLLQWIAQVFGLMRGRETDLLTKKE